MNTKLMDKWYVSMGAFKKLYIAENAGHAAQKLLMDAIKEQAKISIFIMGHRAGFVEDIQEMDDNNLFNDIEMLFTHKVMESLLLYIEPEMAVEWREIISQIEDMVKYDWEDPIINKFMKFISTKLS